MIGHMQVAVVQFDMVWEDKAANHRLIEDMLDSAEVPRGTFVLLPELADTGFSMNLDAIVDGVSLAWAKDCARRRGLWLQPGYPRLGADGKGRNCVAIISPQGEVIGQYEKVFPFSYGREAEHYTGGDHLLIRRFCDINICPLICYDLRFPELWRIAADAGAEVFTIGASWPSERQTHWRQLLIARAIENQCFVVAANRVGNDPHLSYAGGSMIIAPSGDILVEADDQPGVLIADLNPLSLSSLRAELPFLEDLRQDLVGTIRVDSG